jgi:hypothetical protein
MHVLVQIKQNRRKRKIEKTKERTKFVWCGWYHMMVGVCTEIWNYACLVGSEVNWKQQ